MKVKRLASILLVAVLLIGMIPISVSAEEVQDGVDFELMVSNSFGGTVTSDDGTASMTLTTEFPGNKNFYKRLEDQNGFSDLFNKTARTEEELKENIKYADAFFKPSTTGVLEGVQQGDIIYLGVKAKIKNPTATYKGIFNYTVYISYDSSKFEPAVAGVEDAPAQYRNMIIPNAIYTSRVNKYAGKNSETDELEAGGEELVQKYDSDCAIGESLQIGESSNANTKYLAVGGKSAAGYHYFASETSWDFVVPMKVKADAEINTTPSFEVVKLTSPPVGGEALAYPTEVQMSAQPYDGLTTIAGSSAASKVISQKQSNDNEISTSKTASVHIQNLAAAPNGTYTDASITNRKNLPYISAQDAKPTANAYAGPNDTLKFPADETSFKVGDILYVYSTKEAADEDLLGTVTIKNENLLGATGWGSDTHNNGDAVTGLTLRLQDDGQTEGSGYGFLKNAQTVWIGRLGAGDEAAGKTLNKAGMKEIHVASEGNMSYTANPDAAALKTALGDPALGLESSKPISVKIGDSVNEVIKNFDISDPSGASDAETPDAKWLTVTAEDGTEVKTSLDWDNLKVTNATGNTKTDTFNVHGDTTIVVPLKSQTVDSTTYGEPTAHYDGNVPVYGATIHVKVTPNAADYYLVNGGVEGKSLTLYGGTASTLQPGDEIQISKSKDGGTTPNNPFNVTIAAAEEGEGIQTVYTIDGDLPAASTEAAKNYVSVVVYHNGEASSAVEVPVLSSSDHNVLGNVEVGTSGGGEILIDPDATVQGILTQKDPEFQVSGGEGGQPVTIKFSQTTWTPQNVTITKNGGTPEEGETAVNSFDGNTTKTANDKYVIKYVIPSGTISTAAKAAGDFEYTNPSGCAFIITTSVVERLQMGKKDGTLAVSNVKNNPEGARTTGTTADEYKAEENLVHWDTFEVADEYGEVAPGDTVKVYPSAEDNTPITTGIVYDKIDHGSSSYTYKIKVEQLDSSADRKPSDTLFFRVWSATDGDKLPTEKLAMGANLPKETYSFSKVVPFSPNTFTVEDKKADESAYTDLAEFYAAVVAGEVESIPSQATVEYGYNTIVDGNSAIDPSTVGTVQVDMTLSGGSDKTSLDGTADTTVTATLPDDGLKAADGTTPVDVPADAAKTTTIKIKLVAQEEAADAAYAGPSIATLAGKTKITNNAYPTVDTVELSGLTAVTKKTFVYYYETAAKAEANDALATITLEVGATEGTANIGEAGKEILAKNGGKLYIRAQEEGGLISEKETTPTEISYGVEDFTLYSVELPDASKEIKRNREQVTTDKTGAQQLAYINDALPKVFNIKAVRYVAGTGGATVADESNIQSGTVTSTANRWTKADGNALAESDLTTVLGTGGDVSTTLKAALAADDFADGKVKLSFKPAGSETNITPAVLFKAENSNSVETKLYITGETEDVVVDIPTDAATANYITASNNNTDDSPAANTDDSVTFNFAKDDAQSTPNMLGTWFRFTVGDNVYIGQLPEGTGESDTETIANKTVNKDTANTELFDGTGTGTTFKGFPASVTNFEVTFFATKDAAVANTAPSNSIPVSMEAITGAIAITAVKSPLSLSFATGTVKMNSDLTGLVKDITKVTVTADGTDYADVPLKTNSAELPEGSPVAATVQWSLWTGTKSGDTVTWSENPVDPTATDAYATALVYGENNAYRLTAELATDAEGKITVGTDVLENSGNILAEIPITLYNKNAPDTFPLQLKAGNSDLYHYGESAEADPNNLNKYAKDELTERKKTEGITKNTFKDDLIFYYMIDSYATYTGIEDVNGQTVDTYAGVAGMQELQGADTMNATELQAWLADEANKDSWSVEELYADGTPISSNPIQKYKADGTADGTTTHIDPRFSLDKTKYVVPFESYTKLDEMFIIRYTINYNGHRYVFDRDVKLTYKPGDLNFDTGVTGADGTEVVKIAGSYGARKMFVPTTEDQGDTDKMAQLDALNMRVGDLNLDTGITGADETLVIKIQGSYGALMPNIRW